MEKWKVKIIDPVHARVNYLVEADFIESSPTGVLAFWKWKDDNKTKKSAVAIFPTHNVLSVIRIMEEPNGQTSETTVQ